MDLYEPDSFYMICNIRLAFLNDETSCDRVPVIFSRLLYMFYNY
jgi:hypothetical protein